MAKKTRTGWVSEIQPNTFIVEDHAATRKRRRQTLRQPTAIYIHGGLGQNSYLDYAGLDEASFTSFELPPGPSFLRDLADAIREHAEDLAAWPDQR